MLRADQIELYAHLLLEVRANARELPIQSRAEVLTQEDAYAVAHKIGQLREAMGEHQVGHKVSFTVPAVWRERGSTGHVAISGPIYDTTVRYASRNKGVQSLRGAVQPCIAPGLVFKLGETPSPDVSLEELGECIEWLAHGFEVLVCPFKNWEMRVPDAIAAFGLHGTLIVGEPHTLSFEVQEHLTDVMAHASVSLSCTGQSHMFLTSGFGENAWDNPLMALWQLHQIVQQPSHQSLLKAGQIVSTAVWSEAYPIRAGETWATTFSGIALPGLTVDFV